MSSCHSSQLMLAWTYFSSNIVIALFTSIFAALELFADLDFTDALDFAAALYAGLYVALY